MRMQHALVLAGAATALAIAVLVTFKFRTIESSASHEKLEATLIAPAPADNGEVDVAASRLVSCRWRVRNSGKVPVIGLKIAASCQCQIEQPPPDILQPGESVEVAVKIVPPNGGVATRIIPLFAQGATQPLGQLSVRLHVSVSPPAWIVAPAAIDLRAIAGQTTVQEFVWDAVEKRTNARWIDDIHVDDPLVVAAVVKIEDLPWSEDGELCLRKYRVGLTAVARTAETHRTQLVFRNTETGRQQDVPVTLEVLPTVSVIPSTVRFESDQGSRQVTLICRLPEINQVTPNFDSALLSIVSIRSQSGRALKFEVMPRMTVTQETETEVFFHSAEGEPARLVVRLLPKS